MNIVLTGSSSHLSRALLPELCKHPEISKVTGIDIKPGIFAHPKFIEFIRDIRDPSITEIIKPGDAVIHTAFIVLRSSMGTQSKNRQLARDINVNGSINIFKSAIQNRAGCLIHISSASVYGALENNPIMITENQPRKVMPGFSYAEDKNKLEDWLEQNEKNIDIRIVRLRPHIILGPNAQDFLQKMLKLPFYPYFKNPQPQIQCTWETDVVDAIIKALFSNASGTFNLASQSPTSFKEIIRNTHRLAIPIPFLLAKLVQNIAWKFTSKLEEPGWIDGMKYSLTLDTTKASKELNWHSTKTSLACAIDTLKNN